MSTDYQIDTQIFSEFLEKMLMNQIDESAKNWLQEKLEVLRNQPKPRDLFLTFSAMPRFLGKDQMVMTEAEVLRASELRIGLSFTGWSVPQAARVLTLCSYPFEHGNSFVDLLDQLFSTAEVSELVALYSALPVLPYPLMLQARASEGVRTNMSVVFDAVVLDNPYPSEYLDEAAWNQMVLKALFMERPLYRIYGLDQRANRSLSKMISNFAHERWAAGRPTSPEMWRPVGKHSPEGISSDLEKLMVMDDPDQKAASVLAAQAMDTDEGESFLTKYEDAVISVRQNNVTWDDIGARWWRSHSN